MSDFAAFFAPTALPAAAGAVAFAPKTDETSTEFAGLLAEFQAALTQQPGNQSGINGLLPANTATPLLMGDGTANPQATIETLLANGAADQTANPEATLVAQLAALQNALQALQAETPAATPANAPATPANKLGLRGTVAPAALEVIAQQPNADASVAVQAKPADATIPPELLAALNNQKPAQPQKHANKAPTSAQAPADSALPAQTTAIDHAAKTANSSSGNNAFGSDTNAHTGANALPHQSAQTGATASSSNPQAFTAAVNAAQTNSVNAPNVTLSTTPPAPAAVPLEALAVNIARKAEAGVSNFDITLHPKELGKLEISLSVADDGRIHAALRAERPETLDMLQRDARQLETQLRQAGLDVNSNSLSFSLSQGNGQQKHQPFVGWPAFADAQATAGAAKEQALTAYVTVRDRDGVDIRV